MLALLCNNVMIICCLADCYWVMLEFKGGLYERQSTVQ